MLYMLSKNWQRVLISQLCNVLKGRLITHFSDFYYGHSFNGTFIFPFLTAVYNLWLTIEDKSISELKFFPPSVIHPSSLFSLWGGFHSESRGTRSRQFFTLLRFTLRRSQLYILSSYHAANSCSCTLPDLKLLQCWRSENTFEAFFFDCEFVSV